MLEARSRGVFTSASDVVGPDGEELGWYRTGFLGGGSMVVNQFPYRVSRAGFGGWAVEQEGVPGTVARALRARIFRTAYEVDWDGGQMTVERVGFGFRMHLVRDDEVVGSVSPRHIFSKSWIGEFPDDVPLVVATFVLWLVERLRRSSGAAAGGGGG